MSSRSVSVQLSVPEMDCPTCAGKVDHALADEPGVNSVSLRPTTGRVDVAFDPSVTSIERVTSAIEGAGYAVEAVDDEQVRIQRRATWRTRRAILTALGAAFAILGGLLSLVFVQYDVRIFSAYWWTIDTSHVAYILAVVVAGSPILRDGYYSLRQRNLDIDFLMSIAIVGAVGANLPFEGAMLAVLYSIAELLERYAMDRANRSLRELLELAPKTARVIDDGTEEVVDVASVTPGDLVAVRPGERIPIDGTIETGHATIDQSPITGESIPVEAGDDDDVFAGSIVETGYIEIRVTAAADSSTLARIIELVEDAETGRTEHEQFVNRFASIYTPFVVAVAVLVAVSPPLVVGASWQTWFLRGLTLLVIACPCAFVISTPVSVVSGITSAARNGVLIKGGRHLEALADIEVLALDKTGTLTTGDIGVEEVHAWEFDRSRLLSVAGALEHRSEHPIGEAIVAYVEDRDIATPSVSSFEVHQGRGVAGVIDDTRYYIGSPSMFTQIGIDLQTKRIHTDGGICQRQPDRCGEPGCTDLTDEVLADIEARGMTAVLVGTDERILGAIALSDRLKPEAKTAIDQLHESGMSEIVLLTGDNEGAANRVATELGIDTVHAELLPEEKLEYVRDLERRHGGVAMVGDGINDAPALAAAQIGIAMGAAGTDTAIEAADVALMGDDLRGLPYLTRLSDASVSIIRQNIYSSLVVKAVLAIGAPFGIVTVIHAVLIGDMGMSLGVTSNAMRLSRLRADSGTPER